ncbi:hypothetical protein P691DRAFT_756120 [Macrolepiota fuliginosa MF-IS2]|uniref:Transmembrane protein n=1 Tax=Macrolepiota fuliginosa MF-IS2 TaxID=1400762 RepID=A0A9P5XKU4_9AGAR|nr:hypothetical protein P691DRAFT_756120 [Macrolepiota fuliginosa MF-IS2]
MATKTILVEDCSPMIEYAPPEAWQDTLANDTLATSYSGGSYHVTSTQGASATFQFRGTGFAITGGRRPGYGPFSVTLDGQQLYNGNPLSDSLVKNNLASVSGLSNDNHTVVLTNTGGTPVDIDTITFQTQIGSTGSNLTMTTIDDMNSSISYLPSADAWDLNPRPEFQDGTLHYSIASDAAASLQFSGNAVALYGTVSPDHADISITIDGNTVTVPSGSMSHVVAVRTQVMLYWANDLAGGEHTMTVTKVQSPNTGPFVDIDSFVVFSAAQTPIVTNTTSGAPLSNTSLSPQETTSRTGIIAGASVAGAMALLLIIVGLFLFLRRQRARRMSNIMKASITPTTPTLPMQMEYGMARPPAPDDDEIAFRLPPFSPLAPLRNSYSNKRSSRLSIAPSYYGDPDPTYEQMSERRTSSGSSDLLIPPVPRLGTPRTPESLRTIPRVTVTDTTSPSQPHRPRRPRRSPTLNLGSLQ